MLSFKPTFSLSSFTFMWVLLVCLILIFSIAYSPIYVHAYTSPFAVSGYGALFSMLFSSDFVSDAGKGIDAFSGLIGDVWLYLSKDTRSILSSYESAGNDSFRLHGTVVDEVFRAFSAIGFKQILNYGVRHSKVDLNTEALQKEDLIQENTELYLPTMDQIENLDLLSAQQLIVDYTKEQNRLTVLQNNILLNLYSTLESYFDSVSDKLSLVYSSIVDLERDLELWLYTVNGSIVDLERDLELWLYTVNASINDLERDLELKLSNIYSKMADFSRDIESLSLNLKTSFSQVVEKLEAIEKQLLIFPKHEHVEILTKPQIQVQIHDQQQILVQDYATLGHAFEMKLSWISQIFDFLRELFNRIVYTGEPPKVSVSFSTTAGSAKFNKDAVILDMSWYEPYKAYGDTIISGFLWLGFGWNLYKRTPSILNGIGISQEPYANGSNKRGDDDV